MPKKKSILVVTILFILASFLVSQGAISAQTNTAPEANKALWLEWWEVEAEHDYSQLDRFFTPDITRHSTATSAILPHYSVTSLVDYQLFLEGTAAMFPDYRIMPVIVTADDDYVGFYGNFVGTFAENGNRLNVPMMGFARFDDGLVAELWVEWDNVTWDSQMNAIESPAMSIDDVVGVWGITVDNLHYSLEFTVDGVVILGLGNNYEEADTFSVQDGQFTSPSTDNFPCDVMYNVFATRDANGSVLNLRFELVGEDCSLNRVEALDGNTIYPYNANQ